jgi:hypothetical protein
LASPIRSASGAAGRADLQRPRVPDRLHQRLGAAEVWHQPQRRLSHRELRVVGHYADIAGQRKLEAGADRMSPDRRDAH